MPSTLSCCHPPPPSGYATPLGAVKLEALQGDTPHPPTPAPPACFLFHITPLGTSYLTLSVASAGGIFLSSWSHLSHFLIPRREEMAG